MFLFRLAVVLLLLAGGVNAGIVCGFVRDAGDGEPLAYANVELKGTGLGTTTGQKGYFCLRDVPAGSYELEVSYIGYQPYRQGISVADAGVVNVNVELRTEPVRIDEVKVTAERARFEREVQISTQRIDTRQLVLVPKLGGEVDILRSVAMMPGVITVSDFSNKLYIRGGSPDQNLILLDGITVYNPAHLFGIFSPFIAEAVSDVTLYAGGFPAQYGSRLSSVLEVNTRQGNTKRYTGEGSVSIIAAKGIVEGPIPRGSFLFAGRRTYLPDVILKLFGVAGLNYYFYDLMGKVNYGINDNQQLSFALLGSEDVLSFWDPGNPDAFKTRLSWGNRGVSLRLNSVFNPVLYGEVITAWSNFFSGFKVRFSEVEDLTMKGELNNWSLRANFTWYPLDRHTVGFGLDGQINRMGLRVDFDTTRFNARESLFPVAIYVDDKYEVIKKKLFVRPGIRFAYYSKGNRLEPEPRLGLKYLPERNMALNLSLGRFTQPLVTLNSTEAIFSIYDVWVPVPENRRLPSAWHYILGVERWLREDFTVQVEGYYKDYSHLLETRYGDFFTPPDSLLDADGYSLGTELLVRKNSGRINGWLAYSYMWTVRQIETEVYHPHYDRRHNLNLVLNFPSLILNFDLSLHLTVGSGLPYSGAIGYYQRVIERPGGKSEAIWWVIGSERDGLRYPVYHRVDLGLSRTGRIGRMEVGLFLDIINLYNARNVLLYYWDVNPEGIPERHQINMIPILPTLGIRARF